MRRRLFGVGVIVTMVAAACSWLPVDAVDRGDVGGLGGEFGSETVAAAVDLLAIAGIVVRERPDGEPLVGVDRPGPISLLRFQARNLALEANKGGGTPGADLDAYTESGGGAPVSGLIAGWAEQRATPSAVVAAGLLKLDDSTDTPTDPAALVIPGLVAALFLGDITGSATGDASQANENTGTAADSGPSAGTSPRAEPADFCADVAAYLSTSLEDTLDPGRPLDPAWLQAAIDRFVPLETDPERIRTAIGATALLVYASSISKPWAPILVSNPLGELHHRVGSDATPIDPADDPNAGPLLKEGPLVDDDEIVPANQLRLSVDVGEGSFADETAECVALAGVELTPHDLEGTKIHWHVDNLAPHASSVEGDLELDENGMAGLEWEPVGEEEDDHREGTLNKADVRVSAFVVREDIDTVRDVVESLLTHGELGVAAPEVEAAFERFGAKLVDLLLPLAFGSVPIAWHTPGTDDPDPAEAGRGAEPPEPGRAPTHCPPVDVIAKGFPTTATGHPANWELQDIDLSTIESLGSKLGIFPAMPHELGTLSCVYEDPADALPQIIPGLPVSRTMTIVGVVPSEKQPPPGAREIPMAGVTRAWFEQTLLWVVVDGWTLGVPSIMGSPDREKSAIDVSQAVIAWSR